MAHGIIFNNLLLFDYKLMIHREEFDSFGCIKVDMGKLWGAQT